jgi:Na+/H+ antiporter NhaD/arsenite permease-like protein
MACAYTGTCLIPPLFGILANHISIALLPPFLLAVGLLTVCCLFVRGERLRIAEDFPERLPKGRTVLYLVLFAASLLIVFRVIPYLWGLIAITAALVVADRRALRDVDYPLLLTFVFFFIFAGNLSRVPIVHEVLSGLMEKDALLVSVFSCQGISNVPSAILLSRFTDNYRALLLGVNIGGTGTIIASLASLITYSEYKTLYPRDAGRYLKLFTVMNLIFLVIMTVAAKLFFV